MVALSDVIRVAGDTVLWPFVRLPPLLAVAVFAVLSSVVLLLCFRRLTPQRRLSRVKDLMGAAILEIRIFSAYPRRVLAAQGRAIGLLVAYLALSLPALLVLGPPIGVLLARAATHYDTRPLNIGETAQLEFAVAPSAGDIDASSVSVTSLGPGVVLEGPLVYVKSLRRGYTRLRTVTAGVHSVRVELGGKPTTKTVSVGTDGPVSVARAYGWSNWAWLTHEARLTAPAGLSYIGVNYPQREEMLWGIPWWGVFLVLTLVVAFALRRRLGVAF